MLEAYRSASNLDSPPQFIQHAICLANLLIITNFANMDANTNTTVSTRTDLECLWAAQRRLNFIPPHPAQVGGMARFDSSAGMVSHTTTASYPHPANSTVGAYPNFNEVSYHRLPQLVEVDDWPDLCQDAVQSDPSRGAEGAPSVIFSP